LRRRWAIGALTDGQIDSAGVQAVVQVPFPSRIRLAGRFKHTVWFDPDERIRILRNPEP
jgi:hypothetical protein